MENIQKNVKEFMLAAGQKCPTCPIEPDDKSRILRVRLLLEEVLELAQASGVRISIPVIGSVESPDDGTPIEINLATVELDDLKGVDFEVVAPANIIEVADALADINYVSYGAAIAYGLDMESFDKEVHCSNMSKFIDGHKDPETGKWIKGPSYRAVNFKPILEAQQHE
jgi:predicted HAD superfamily Cof-like phosphohydrolase